MEHAEAHLRAMLAFIGISAPEFIIAEGIAIGPEERNSAVQAALNQASGLALSQLAA